jgi:hypothetical protein
MRQAVPLEAFPDNEALTRAELVHGYTVVEKHRERVSTGRRCWVDRIPQPDGRVEVRTYEHGRLVSVNREMPLATPQRHIRGVWGTRLA